MQTTRRDPEPPARTHTEAAALLRRPFAPGAIGFRAMMKVPYDDNPVGGAHVAAYLGAQSVLQRLNAVVPGRWRMEFKLLPASPGASRRYMTCRLGITLPMRDRGREVEAVYEDVGELEIGSPAGLKALYSDARKRAAVAAGIGAYLYTSLRPVVLPLGVEDRQVQVICRSGADDLLMLSTATEEWLRDEYANQVSTEAARRDLGEILAHGELEHGAGQSGAAEQPPEEPSGIPTEAAGEHRRGDDEGAGGTRAGRQNGLVLVDCGGPGPDAA
jgi:hypothetical protein